MDRFSDGQRVVVRAVGEFEPIKITPTHGTVRRLRRSDDGAWIRLDQRVDTANAHPFGPDDPRGADVLAFPEDCDPA